MTGGLSKNFHEGLALVHFQKYWLLSLIVQKNLPTMNNIILNFGFADLLGKDLLTFQMINQLIVNIDDPVSPCPQNSTTKNMLTSLYIIIETQKFVELKNWASNPGSLTFKDEAQPSDVLALPL